MTPESFLISKLKARDGFYWSDWWPMTLYTLCQKQVPNGQMEEGTACGSAESQFKYGRALPCAQEGPVSSLGLDL